MSDEILKALMQLFAIIAKQDTGASAKHRLFIESFLKNQVAKNKVVEYLELYDTFLIGKEKEAKANSGEEKEKDEKPKLTSVLDSVKTLAICKKINKTLDQKQKVVVLIRLYELIKTNNEFTTQRLAIIDTVATVFNIHEIEKKSINFFVTTEDAYGLELNDLLVLDDKEIVTLNYVGGLNHVHAHGLDGFLLVCKVQSVNLYFFRYEGENELFLNGLPIKRKTVYNLAPGSTIRLPQGTKYYSELINYFSNEFQTTQLFFQVKGLEFTFPNGKVALNNVNLDEKSNTLFGIMGASGSGKTTLLNVLCGNEKPSKGEVTINGITIHKEKHKIEGVIGYISQDDLLFEELSVYQNLYYNAQLCFKDKSHEQLDKAVCTTLDSLGLLEIKNIVVGSPLNKKISGGQRKRLNIALELIREPAVLFVDEPTSGLSSRDSENVMDLLKQLSQKGKLIFVVIHQPSSDIYKMFDKLLLLDVGGFPIYYGNPIEGIMYFKKATNQLNQDIGECDSCGNVNPELMFNLIEAKEVNEYGETTESRRLMPKDWYEMYQNSHKLEHTQNKNPETNYAKQTPNRLKQLLIFIKRDLACKISNKQYLLINLLETPALALILALFIKHSDNNLIKEYSYHENSNIPAFFFMSIVVALLIGLTISAEEIYKDQKILKREKFLNLSKFAYLKSKVIILFTVSLIQALLFSVIGFMILKISIPFLPFLIILYSVFCFANLVGLILSSTFNSPVTIYIIIPLIIIPQMILGGAMFKFSTLNEYMGGSKYDVPAISNGMISRWAYEAMAVEAFKTNDYEKNFYYVNKIESKLNYKVSYVLPKLEEYQELILNDNISDKEKAIFQKLLDKSIEDEVEYFKDNYGLIIFSNVKREKLFEEFKSLYSLRLNELRQKKEILIKEYCEKNKLTIKEFKDLEYKYTNKNLIDIVTANNEKSRIEFDSASNSLIQIFDPVYKDLVKPNKFFSYNAHFYAANKFLFGKQQSTFVVNLFVIWMFNILIFLILYFDLFKKIITFKPTKNKNHVH